MCPFCKLSDERVRFQNEFAVAIFDAFPLTRGHFLIVPKRHVQSLFDTTEPERCAIFDLLDIVKKAQSTDLCPDGYNVGINDGAAAGQTIAHLHVHLIPRYSNDCPDPRWGGEVDISRACCLLA